MMKIENLPKDYYSYLKYNETILRNGDGEIFLWKIKELEQFNMDYESHIYTPNYYFIASNGSGVGLAYNLKNYKLYSIPFVGMDENDALLVADNFNQLLDLLKKGRLEIH